MRNLRVREDKEKYMSMDEGESDISEVGEERGRDNQKEERIEGWLRAQILK